MECRDCSEPIIESERRGARVCVVCEGVMHGECAMAGLEESDNCEDCYNLEQAGFADAMAGRGVEA